MGSVLRWQGGERARGNLPDRCRARAPRATSPLSGQLGRPPPARALSHHGRGAREAGGAGSRLGMALWKALF